jgi:hypothetical protein
MDAKAWDAMAWTVERRRGAISASEAGAGGAGGKRCWYGCWESVGLIDILLLLLLLVVVVVVVVLAVLALLLR